MANSISKDEIFEKLKSDYIEARNNVGYHLLKLTLIVLEANKKLSKRSWSRWLKDPKINIKHTQAKKLIAIAMKCKNNGQLTDHLNKNGIEKTYLICQMKDDATRNNLAEQIIDADFTFKQTKEVIKKVEDEKLPAEQAIQVVKSQPKNAINKSEKTTVSIETYQKLKTDYDALLKEKENLEKQLEELKKIKPCQCGDKACSSLKETNNVVSLKTPSNRLEKPVKTDLENGIVNADRHSVTYQGYELPLPIAFKNIEDKPINSLIIAATNRAKNEFGIELS